MKVLVTGISGFVGTYLANFLLKEKFKVTGMVLGVTKKVRELGEGIEAIEGNLLDADFIKVTIKKSKPDLIFHLASLTSPAASFKNPSQTILNNIGITINILEAAKGSKARILIVGSAD